MKVLVELHEASDVPPDEESKQVFSMSGDFWITARYKAGDWIDEAEHAVVNVACWCELPHPSNLTEIVARTVYEEGESGVTIAD